MTTATDAKGRTVTSTYDQYGHLLTTRDRRNVTTTFGYTYGQYNFGRLTSVPQGSKQASSMTYFEPSGLVATATTPRPGGGGTVTRTFTYDALGNLLTMVEPGHAGTPTVTTTLNYTSDGAYTQAAAFG